jgi:predicted RNase H-like HicB family nuclease
MQFTVNIERGENDFYVGQIIEVPAAISQGKTIDDLKINLLDALNLILGESTEIYSIQFQN